LGGFYFLKVNDLVLGPFQSKPACVRIPLGKGVCAIAGEKTTRAMVPMRCI
jgi:GAF domain-containing protein